MSPFARNPDQSLTASLGDHAPLAGGRVPGLEDMPAYSFAAPRRLREHGYWSGFFNTGDLGFLDKPSWLRALETPAS